MVGFITLIVSSSLIIGCGYILNDKNAKYYLAGYWNLSKEDKEKVNLVGFLRFFKRFHLLLGVSMFSIGIISSLIIDKLATLFILMILIVLAYVYMGVYSSRYWRGLKEK